MLQTGSEVSGDICGNENVHPFEELTELTNILEFCLGILIITIDSVCTGKCLEEYVSVP